MQNEQADVVVVGAGIVGACTALALQRTGRSVTLIERGEPGSEASGHNGGAFWGDCMPVGTPEVIRALPRMLVDPMSPLAIRWRDVPRLTPWLTRYALASRRRRVEEISLALGALTSRGVEAYRDLTADFDVEDIFEQKGILSGYSKLSSFESGSKTFELRRRRGVPYEVLDADSVGSREPLLAGKVACGVYFPSARYTTDPQRFTNVLVAEFEAAGGRRLKTEATGFDVRGDVVATVRTGVGEVSAGAVVICAGPWSRKLLRMLRADVPLEVERGYGIDLPAPGMSLACPFVFEDHHVAFSPHRDGLRLSGRNELAGLAAPPKFRLADNLLRSAKELFPDLETQGASRWMRSRPSTPDSLPVIGPAPRHRNAYLAFGHGHKGLGTGAITARLIRELIDGDEPTINLAPYQLSRFGFRYRSNSGGPTAVRRDITH
jgi:glycine/D-amino acid oxidase-like deaminating enzyme